jgi:hypothetical protein
MAQVRNIKVTLGRNPSGLQFAEVAYDVQFEANEIALNSRFIEAIYLAEPGEEFETDDLLADAGVMQLLRGTADDFLSQIFVDPDGNLRPDGASTLHRVHRKEWDEAESSGGGPAREEYQALVFVAAPDLAAG